MKLLNKTFKCLMFIFILLSHDIISITKLKKRIKSKKTKMLSKKNMFDSNDIRIFLTSFVITFVNKKLNYPLNMLEKIIALPQLKTCYNENLQYYNENKVPTKSEFIDLLRHLFEKSKDFDQTLKKIQSACLKENRDEEEVKKLTNKIRGEITIAKIIADINNDTEMKNKFEKCELLMKPREEYYFYNIKSWYNCQYTVCDLFIDNKNSILSPLITIIKGLPSFIICSGKVLYCMKDFFKDLLIETVLYKLTGKSFWDLGENVFYLALQIVYSLYSSEIDYSKLGQNVANFVFNLFRLIFKRKVIK